MSANRIPFEEAKKCLAVSSIPKSVRQKLALYLDKFCESNWEYLAEKLEVTPQEIEWVKNTVINSPSGSPTFRLFDAVLVSRDVSLEKFIEALETIKNFASVKALTEGYASGAFDPTLKQLTSNGYKVITNSLQDQCCASILDTYESYRRQYHGSPSFHHPGNHSECPGYNRHRFESENFPKVPSSDGSFPSSDGSSTYGSMDGNFGDSIGYTKFDLDLSPGTDQSDEHRIGFIEALSRTAYQLPSINDIPVAQCRSSEVLDLSKGGPTRAESVVRVEPRCRHNRVKCEDELREDGKGSNYQENLGQRSRAGCQCVAAGRRIQDEGETKCYEPLEARARQYPATFPPEDCRLLPKQATVKHEPLDLDDRVQKPGKDLREKENAVVQDSRSVRIFVTYADDSKKHMRRVMQLCECLKKNNFSVSLDVHEAKLLSQDRMGWYDKRFKVADYVLVLISPKYFQDVMPPEKSKKSPADELALNTLYIHRCMQAEYMENNCMNKRFVPVLMPGALKGHIPVWLQNTTKYIWPDQYKNLFFYMMHPVHVISEFVMRERSAQMPTVRQTNH